MFSHALRHVFAIEVFLWALGVDDTCRIENRICHEIAQEIAPEIARVNQSLMLSFICISCSPSCLITAQEAIITHSMLHAFWSHAVRENKYISRGAKDAIA
jgi:hypothetical protein